MKHPRIRIPTLMLLIVIAGLVVTVVIERRRSAELRFRLERIRTTTTDFFVKQALDRASDNETWQP